MKDKRVSVIWHDASASSTSWISRENAAAYKPYVCETIGWLLRNDKQAVVLAMAKHGEQFTQTFDIPKGMVRKIKTLR